MNTRRNKRQIESDNEPTIDAEPNQDVFDHVVSSVTRDAFDDLEPLGLDKSSPKFDGERPIDAVLDKSSPRIVADKAPDAFEEVKVTVVDEVPDAFEEVKVTVVDEVPDAFEEVKVTVVDEVPDAFEEVKVTVVDEVPDAFEEVKVTVVDEVPDAFEEVKVTVVDEVPDAFEEVKVTVVDAAAGGHADAIDAIEPPADGFPLSYTEDRVIDSPDVGFADDGLDDVIDG